MPPEPLRNALAVSGTQQRPIRLEGSRNASMAAMSGARPRDRDSARQLIAGILKEHGCPPQHVLERMLPEDRQIIEECLLQKDRMIGSSVTT